MKLIILDRDGVINHDSPDFIKSPAEWIPIPGSLEAIARLNQAGYVSGCLPYLVLTGKGQKTFDTGGLPPGTKVCPDLAAMVSLLLKAPMPA